MLQNAPVTHGCNKPILHLYLRLLTKEIKVSNFNQIANVLKLRFQSQTFHISVSAKTTKQFNDDPFLAPVCQQG